MKIVISENAYKETIDFLSDFFDVIVFKDQHRPYKAVSNHPDIFMFYDKKLFIEKNIDLDGVPCEEIGNEYPEDVKFNIAKIDNYIICNEQYISDIIKRHIKENNYEIINVKQGYAKCSTLIIKHGIITSDKGIYKACKGKVDALLIEEGDILLPPLSHGFIGGSAVYFNDIVFFNGDITKHRNYEKIREFILRRGLEIRYIDRPLMDIGSFIIIEG